MNLYSIVLCSFLLFKWISDYRMCTVSYIEIKLRGIPKEKGIMYNFMEDVVDFNKCDIWFIFYIGTLSILLRNIYLVYKQLKHSKKKSTL